MLEKKERIPWYRAKGYKGKMTEDNKRKLDAFRMLEKHPATDPYDLPEDAQTYINSIEFELIDIKRQKSFNGSAFITAAAFALSYYSYLGHGYYNNPYWTYAFSIVIVIFVWWKHHKEDKTLCDELLSNTTTEGIIREWELDYITTIRRD